MDFSYKIVSVAGIDIELHFLFLLFILAFLFINPLFSLLLVLVFFYVTLHELCHSLVARRNGIKVKKIILLPIGGMSMIDTTDIKPAVEIKMAIAGPLFNFAMVYVMLAIAWLVGAPLGSWVSGFLDGTLKLTLPELLLFYSFYANFVLGIFNLFVPAFPLDGGRVLRAVLALRMDPIRATNVAKNISIAIAAVMFLFALVIRDLWIMVIAFFVAFGAIAEYETTILQRTLARVRISDLVRSEYTVVSPTEKISRAVQRMLAGRSTSLLVKGPKGVRVVDMATIASLPREKWSGQVKAIARAVRPIHPDTDARVVLKDMAEHGVDVLPVYVKEKMVGIVQRDDLERMIRIMELLKK